MPKKCVGYVRISQKDEDPDNQKYVIRKWAEENGYEILFAPVEEMTGEEDPLKRPMFRLALELARENGINTIVMSDIQRFSRNYENTMKRLSELATEGFKIIFINTPLPSLNEFYATIEKVFSETGEDNPYTKVMKRAIRDILRAMLDLAGEIALRLYAAQGEAYLQEVKMRTRIKMQRLKEEGKLYHRPDLIWKYAAWLFGKKVGDVTVEEYEKARERMSEMLRKHLAQGKTKKQAFNDMLQEDLKPFVVEAGIEIPRNKKTIYRYVHILIGSH